MHLGKDPRESTHDMMWYGATEAKIEPAIVAFSSRENRHQRGMKGAKYRRMR